MPYLSQLENGKIEPKLGLLNELADALDTTTADLLERAAPIGAHLEIELERDARACLPSTRARASEAIGEGAR